MQPVDKDAGLLWDMLQACSDAWEFSREVEWEDFMRDRKLQLAVERCLEIVGEAAGKISAEFQAANPQIPWRQIKGMRNILIHDYGHISYELVYETVTEKVPELLRALEALLPGLQGKQP